MKPIYLEMQAFGPYAGRQVVDFRLLKGRRFFLIYGPTGSGKTTILDAMCYALYGKTSGDQRSGENMRSKYVTTAEPTSVSFTFSIGEKTYRVERSPKQHIDRKRGGGTRDVASKAALYRIQADGTEELMAAKDVSEEVEGLLGFKSEQFRQVVLLPQGDFRQLLLASSKERQQIMQTLFHTQRYARLQELAKNRHDAIEKQYQVVGDRMKTRLEGAGAATMDDVTGRLERLVTDQKETTEKLTAARKSQEEAEQSARKAQTLYDHWQDLKRCRKEMEERLRQKEAVEEQRLHVEALKKARLFADPIHYLDDLERQGKEKGASQEKAEKERDDAAARLARGEEDLKRLEKDQDKQAQRQHDFAVLQSLEAKAKRYSAVIAEATAAQQAQKEAQDAYAKAAAALAAWKQDDAVRQEQLGQSGAVMTAWEQAKQALKALQDKLAAEKKIEDLAAAIASRRKDVEKGQKAAAAAAENARQDKLDYESIQNLFLQGQAAFLAEGLLEGTPCPVCGATHHPQPAVASDELPQKSDVEKRKKKAEKSEDRRQALALDVEKAVAALQEQQKQYDALRREQPFDGTIDDLMSRVEAARQAEGEKAAQAQAMTALQKEQVSFKAKGQRLEKDEQELRRAADEKRLALTKAVEGKKAAEADLPERYRPSGALAKAMDAIQKAIQDYDQRVMVCRNAVVKAKGSHGAAQGRAEELQKQVQTLRDQYGAYQVTLAGRVHAAGFSSIGECRGLIKEMDRLAGLEQAVTAYDAAVQQLQGRLAQAQAAVGTEAEPDMAAFNAAVDQWKKACNDLIATAASQSSEQKQLTAVRDDLQKWQAEQAALTEQYQTVGAVYELISGKGTGVNFESYVLGALLDDVLMAANLRLSSMSRHRYELQRSHDWEDRRVKQIGLDIEVFDNYTGEARPANTLSGGETFLASLSLALGLADVVQSYAGGIHLDTIFIDEGFGTLDSETLDYALKSLLQLQQGGRLVGIISHVPELKERIDTRLAVTKTDRGSTVAFEVV